MTEPTAETSGRQARAARWAWARRIGRVLLLVVGIVAVVLLVRDAGPDRVLATLLAAAVWLPAIAALEIAFMTMDVVALRSLLGEDGTRVPLSVWIRTGLVQYGVMIILPAGRAGGEVARAAGLAPYVGGGRAAAMATRLQAATMLGNSAISIPCWIAVALASHAGSGLAWAVLINGTVTFLIGGAILAIARRSRLGAWLGAKIPMLASHGPEFDAALGEDARWAPAIAATTAGRAFQSLQYGIILLAVGGSLTVVSALVSQAIHLVGAGAGDLVPNAAGITEGAYRLFAPALGLEQQPARALGIALVARICQYSLAGIALATTAMWRAPHRPSGAEGAIST